MPSVAFIPSTPLLVPDIAVDSSAELDQLRSACAQGVSAVLSEGPSAVAIVAPGPATRILTGPLIGSFHGFGAGYTVATSQASPGGGTTPVWWTTALGIHALSGTDWSGDVVAVEVCPSAEDVDEATGELVAQLGNGQSWSVIVVGDGSAALSVKAPGYLIPGAEDVDRALASAVLSADFDGLRNIDLEQAHWAMVGGAGVFVYVVLWLLVPRAEATTATVA